MSRYRIFNIALPVALAAAAPWWCAASAQAQESAAAEPATEIDAGEPALEQTPEGLRLNFRGVPLDTVLDALSREAGFTIVREVAVDGRVDVVSHRPLSQDEVVELLNGVLNGKGYAAIRNGRTLTIVSRDEAKTRNIPVKIAASPEEIPNSDEMVTQIIPIRHADATKLLENLKPLLASYSVASANESSNAIILTDTQANIRRMAEIVQALDTSISSISTVTVFPLHYADAEETASLITKVFENDDSGSSGGNNRQNSGRRFFGRGGFPFGGDNGGGDRGGDQSQSSGDSPAREAVSRVVAVAETRTNSVVVAAPDDLMGTITNLVNEIDTVSGGDVQIRVFTLAHASAEDMAQLLNDMFEEENTTGNQTAQVPRFFGPGGPFGGGGGGRGGRGQSGNNTQTPPSDATVNAQADVRTNSVVVSAPAEMLDQIAEIVRELDKNPARQRKVFVYSLKNSDPESVAAIVQGMFESSGTGARNTNANRTTRTGTTNTQQNNRNTNNTNTNRNNSNTNSQSRN